MSNLLSIRIDWFRCFPSFLQHEFSCRGFFSWFFHTFPEKKKNLNHQEFLLLLTSWYSTYWFLHDTSQSSAQNAALFPVHGSISWYLNCRFFMRETPLTSPLIMDHCNVMFATKMMYYVHVCTTNKTPRRTIEPWRTFEPLNFKEQQQKLLKNPRRCHASSWIFERLVFPIWQMNLLNRKFHALLSEKKTVTNMLSLSSGMVFPSHPSLHNFLQIGIDLASLVHYQAHESLANGVAAKNQR